MSWHVERLSRITARESPLFKYFLVILTSFSVHLFIEVGNSIELSPGTWLCPVTDKCCPIFNLKCHVFWLPHPPVHIPKSSAPADTPVSRDLTSPSVYWTSSPALSLCQFTMLCSRYVYTCSETCVWTWLPASLLWIWFVLCLTLSPLIWTL